MINIIKNLFFCSLPVIIFLIACNCPIQEQVTLPKSHPEQINQYSVFAGLANKMYEGNLTIGQLKANGEIGLGTFNGLNGELIMVDQKVYQFLSDGTLREPSDNELIPFATYSFFNQDILLEPSETMNFDELKAFIENHLPSRNYGYAFKIRGNFKMISCGGATVQEKPYRKALSEALIDRPVFQAEGVKGTIVGFWIPEYWGKAYILGFHLHFISDDGKTAGHVMELTVSDIKIGVDFIREFRVTLPDTETFRDSTFDLTQDYSRPCK